MRQADPPCRSANEPNDSHRGRPTDASARKRHAIAASEPSCRANSGSLDASSAYDPRSGNNRISSDPAWRSTSPGPNPRSSTGTPQRVAQVLCEAVANHTGRAHGDHGSRAGGRYSRVGIADGRSEERLIRTSTRARLRRSIGSSSRKVMKIHRPAQVVPGRTRTWEGGGMRPPLCPDGTWWTSASRHPARVGSAPTFSSTAHQPASKDRRGREPASYRR